MKKIILALDINNKEKALKLVSDMSPYIDLFKVGPILFLKEGKEIIKMIKGLGKEVFLDLKFHDIPATVQRSVESAKELGVYSLTVHSSGGREMLYAASSVANRPKIWAVTVLTSHKAKTEEIAKKALFAKECGLDGVIASPLEIEEIKKVCGKDFTVVTPGIRTEKIDDDQKRIATPASAVKAGADFIVIGRPIIEAQNPIEVAKKISEEIEK
ncbi:MAG: orotidine-5'-phosphate decarboxylase [Elusimicrobia bacterium]|nr:orotidine-5'-phosphate decarboxylase [Elusimicrobiota bacterium]